MQEVMKKVNELFDMLTAKNKQADALAVTQAVKNEEQKTILTAQSEKDIALTERETKVAKIEDILAVKRENEKMSTKTMQEKESLANAISTHTQQVGKDKQALLELDKDTKSNLAALKEERAKFEQDLKDFEERKKKIKEEAIAEIIKNK